MFQRTAVLSCAVLLWLQTTAGATELPYRDAPAIIKALDALGDRASDVLPPVTVHAGDLTMHGMDKYGPGQRDYCNKMTYAPTGKRPSTPAAIIRFPIA